MIRINRGVAALLLGASTVLVCDAWGTTQARPLTDRTLSLIIGSNGPQKGSGSYDCSDSSVTNNTSGNKWITTSNCGSLLGINAPNNTICVGCQGPSASSYSADANGTPLTYQGTVDCTKGFGGNATQLTNQGTCTAPTNNGNGQAKAICDNPPPFPNNKLGTCLGTFSVWSQQPMGGPGGM